MASLSLPILTKHPSTPTNQPVPVPDTPNPLVSIICTEETIQSDILTQILTEAYAKNPTAPPSLIILSTNSTTTIQQLTPDSATQPPLKPFTSPFLGMTETKVAEFIATACAGSAISSKLFYIADDRTAATGTLQAVFMYSDDHWSRASFPMEWEFANVAAVGVMRDPERGGEKLLSVIWKGIYRGKQGGEGWGR
ncbi:uncharacterized protein BO80DRAFT_448477 [Aspergillus ibericus CBS 121593]|uniref:Uncharacterized protein n=1 Tax=Aspergillus ibericus CBS 121593 TaxID=1448316 RepID=A0A395GPQ9_9EURO|nr:hypothetical protein BO80DRAFT_448477 [Aspergillus ibericus CBS 121593]RAK97302.1 hypothetical protein BO80DRAFT_448477 [Aspergillus ibericus CBS 121593]